ncbi:hypothetical protein JCM3774_006627 [Rhodotorula dairenensis]
MAAPLAGPSGVRVAAQGQRAGHAGDTRLSDSLRRWSAAVRVEGVETEVYKVEHGMDKTTCYIVAEEGMEFEIMTGREAAPDNDEATILSIDGMVITAHHRHADSRKDEDTFKGKRISATEIRPFVFAPIALTDDPDEAVQDERIIQGMGTIRLNFHRVVRQGVDKRKRSTFSDTPAHRALLEAEGIVEALPAPELEDDVDPVRASVEADVPASPSPAPAYKTPSSNRPACAPQDRPQAEIAALRGAAKPEPASSPMQVKREATLAQENIKVLEEDGQIVLELLDDD